MKGNINGEIKNGHASTISSPLLDKGKENGKLLGMDKGEAKHGIRTVLMEGNWREEIEDSSAQVVISGDDWKDPSRNVCMPQMRQPDLCEPESLVSGNTSRKYDGCKEEGQDGEKDKKEMPERPQSCEKEDQTGMSSLSQHKNSTYSSNEKQKPSTIQVSSIEINEKGIVQAKNNTELLRYCGALAISGAVPDRFNNPSKLFGALMFVRDLGLPDTAIRQVANIDGVPSLFGDLPLSLVQSSGELESFKEVFFDKNYDIICRANKNLNSKVYGAECVLSRKTNTDKFQSFSFTFDDAGVAGLYPCHNPKKPWAKYPNLMLRYRSRSMALKSLFADKINGVSIAEYDHNETFINEKEIKDVGPSNDAAEIEKALSGQ